MSWWSKATGADGRRERRRAAEWDPYGGQPAAQYRQAIGDYRDPTTGMDQLTQLIQSQVSRGMPQFNAGIQNIRETANRRGISNGDLGTSYEGDLASAFQQNLTDSIAGQTFDLYQGNRNTYLDLLAGQLDRDDMNRNAGKNRSAALWGSAIGTAGNVAGSFGGG